MTNGYQSEYFNISRGIRQGDSLSALLYIIQCEPLAEKLRTYSTIKGISVELKNSDNESINIKGCQYVDDSNNMLENISQIQNFLDVMNKYEKVSGSKINIDKTVALTVKENMENTIKDLKITTGPEKVLGIPLGKDKYDNKVFLGNTDSKN